jgi:serine/threonine protein kinase
LFGEQGAMSRMFLVNDQHGQELLLKQLLELGGLTNEQKADLTIRFMREVDVLRGLTRLNDPRFIRLVDHEASTTPSFYIMELIPGAMEMEKAIAAWGALDPLLSIQVMGRVVGALDRLAQNASPAGRAAGFSHRDIKPGNIIFSVVDGKIKRVVLIDLGIMRLPDSILTALGQYYGTPGYSAPETINRGAASADQRSDIFSLGCVHYALATGRDAFDYSSSILSFDSLQPFGSLQGVLWKALRGSGYIDGSGLVLDKVNEGPRKFDVGYPLSPADREALFSLVNGAQWITRFYAFGSDPATPLKELYRNKPPGVPHELWQNIFAALNPAPEKRFQSFGEYYQALSALSTQLGGAIFPPL